MIFRLKRKGLIWTYTVEVAAHYATGSRWRRQAAFDEAAIQADLLLRSIGK